MTLYFLLVNDLQNKKAARKQILTAFYIILQIRMEEEPFDERV